MITTTSPVTASWFAAEKHKGQKYGNLPYIYHLVQAVSCLENSILSLPALRFYDHDVLRSAVWLHDVVEDTETSIFELSKLFDPRVVELVDAVTDGPGKNRSERKAPMYRKVRAIGTPALAVKLADRLANALVCGLSKEKGRMLEMYQKEQHHFEEELRSIDPGLIPAWNELRHHLGLPI
jgi:(p)ppGpp synthase/HD superfamily hydrolase